MRGARKVDKYRNLYPAGKNDIERTAQIVELIKLRDIARENGEILEAARIELRIFELERNIGAWIQ
jgi:hypothetical protein